VRLHTCRGDAGVPRRWCWLEPVYIAGRSSFSAKSWSDPDGYFEDNKFLVANGGSLWAFLLLVLQTKKSEPGTLKDHDARKPLALPRAISVIDNCRIATQSAQPHQNAASRRRRLVRCDARRVQPLHLAPGSSHLI
jgi:hypothetical protein